jgi:hypothetical protein
MAEGIQVRHSRSCTSRVGAKCSCEPSYQAHVWSKRDGKRIRKTFPTLAAARSWRTDAKKPSKTERCAPRVPRRFGWPVMRSWQE